MNKIQREQYNAYFREYMKRWFIKRKLDAIAYKGGSCKKCGYDKCHGALTFHHRDPSEKQFEWTTLKKRSWSEITKELDKCDLLCCRCHAEEHDEGLAEEAIEWLATHKRPGRQKTTANCEYCGQTFYKNSGTPGKFCNRECHDKFRWKSGYPDNDEFVRIVDEIGRVQTALRFKVSHRAIAKRYNKIKKGN